MNENWQDLLRAAQDEIAALDCNPQYVRVYRDTEMPCWQHIPEWMHADSQKRKATRGIRRTRCVDIGCGYGTLALYYKKLTDCEVYCTDFIDCYMSQSLLKKHPFAFVVNNVELDPFPWQLEFDVVIFTEVLEHLNFHPVPTLKKIRNLLSKKGRVYLSTPDASEWGRVTHYYSCLEEMPLPGGQSSVIDAHIYQYTQDELLEILDQAELRVERFDYSPGVLSRHFNLTLVRK